MNISVFDVSLGFRIYVLVLCALMGLVMGSFCNAWAYRAAHNEKISRGRSHCPTCGHVLSPFDLIPLFSWLALGGRCRYCRTPISKRYPAAELISCILYLTVLIRFGFCTDTIRYLILTSLLFTAALVDLDIMEIPDRMLFLAFLDSFLRLISDASAWKDMLIGFFAVSVPLLLVVLIIEYILKKEAMGGGDIKLIAVLGAHFGALACLYLLLIACLIGIAAAAFTRRERDKAFSFGPAIAAAAWVTMMTGTQVVSWYLSLF